MVNIPLLNRALPVLKRISVAFLVFFIFLSFSLESYSSETKSLKEIAGDDFVVYCDNISDGKTVFNLTQDNYPKITSRFNYKPKDKVKIFVYHNHADFIKVAPSKGALGFAQPYQGKVFISASSKNLSNILKHELIHVVFVQSIPDISKVPFWFIEGIAYYGSGPSLSAYEMEKLALSDDLPTIRGISKKDWPQPEEEVEVGRQGYLLVKYIAEVYGEDKLYSLITELQSGKDFSAAVNKSLGVDLKKLEEKWRDFASQEKRRIIWANLKYFSLLIIGLLAMIASVFLLYKRVLTKKKIEELEDNELAEE